jgi:hypothetical protein
VLIFSVAESSEGVVISFEMPPLAIKTLSQRAQVGEFTTVAGFNVISITEDGEGSILLAGGSVLLPSLLIILLCLIFLQ